MVRFTHLPPETSTGFYKPTNAGRYSTPVKTCMNPEVLRQRLPRAAFAFRGYNVTNLGRTAELLAHAKYGLIVSRFLERASAACTSTVGYSVDLAARVREGRETDLDTYAEAVALIVGVSQAQLECLEQLFGIPYRESKMAFGYSLGEISAVAASSVIDWSEALRIPLSLSMDCAELAKGVTLGVLFSRGRMIPFNSVKLLCLEINQEGRGIIGISARLSPNTILLMGQGDTLDRFKERVESSFPANTHLRKHTQSFPPMHTPIVWERAIPNRAGILMHTLQGNFGPPEPPIFSLVTGRSDYNELTARDILQRWTDHPQLLWDAVLETLTSGVEVIIHVGPDPNMIPATYKRLTDNVAALAQRRFGMRAVQAVMRQSWLTAILPESAAVLRAPHIEHVILEDWLLKYSPPG
jgi:[acyl-carrier-protein] S-malonyltransferase